jgi:hypothetical protein
LLPSGSENFFTVRKVGAHFGAMVVCPICEERPPIQCIYGNQRWRWMAAHIATHKPLKLHSK